MRRRALPLGCAVLALAATAAAPTFIGMLRGIAFKSAAHSPWVARHAEGEAAGVVTLDAPTGKCPYSKENMAMEGAPDAESDGLLPGERYIAMNRFQVRAGSEAQFEQRWAQRKSSLLELDGFRWFSLMRRVPPTGEEPTYEYPDDYSYVSFTIWETKKNFNTWRKGTAFKEAHGGGDFFGFIGMVINGFMTSKGPPKPAFWRGTLMEKTTEEKPRLMFGPGGRPDADGQNLLDPDVFVSMNRFTVTEGREREFEQNWAQRENKLQDLPGFRHFQLLRRDQTPDDDVNYISLTVWDDRAAFDNWRGGDSFKKEDKLAVALLRPPQPFFYEGSLVLESSAGA